MIYTYTLNPSIDHYIFTENKILQSETNRAYKSLCVCGGKGINVSLACRALGVKTVCRGICGGFTGKELVRQLEDNGVECNFVITDENTRINTKIVNNGSVTEINAPGAPIDENTLDKLLSLISCMNENDTAVISGSLPYDAELLNNLFSAVKKTGAKFIADTSGEALKQCIKFEPYLIKPNIKELSALFDTEIQFDEIQLYASKLLTKGVLNVIVSCGERGAFFTSENETKYLPVNDVKMKVKNTTGAGDSMIAGFLFGVQNGLDPFMCAVSAGSAAAYCETTLDKDTFFRVYESYHKI